MTDHLLAIRGLDAWYGQAQALFGVDLTLDRGEVVVLLGRNGAGKSTTMKAVMGLVRRQADHLLYDGREIGAESPHRIARLGLGYVPEERRIFTELTVDENLIVGRQPPRDGIPPWTPERLFDLFPALASMRGREAGRMSGGEQQMLAIARTLMGNPEMLLLDEPSEGLAPVIVDRLGETVRTLCEAGVTVLLSEQNLSFALAVGGRGYVLDSGRVVAAGALSDLAGDPEIRRDHLSV